MVRASMTVPKSLKDEMEKARINWSEAMREAIRRKLEGLSGKDAVEAV